MIKVYLATTQGPVQIERITRERIENSLVCVKRSNRILPISASYDAFVKHGSGVVEREFGPFDDGAFRLDVSGAIVDGDSWQLGVYVAHALDAAGRLAGPDDEADETLWLTGRVDYDLRVLPVDFVAKKLAASHDTLAGEAARGRRVRVLVAPDNVAEAEAADLPDGVEVIGVAAADQALDDAKPGPTGVESPTTTVPATRGAGPPASPSAAGARPGTVPTVIVVLLMLAAIAIWMPEIRQQFTEPPAPVNQVDPAPAPDVVEVPEAEPPVEAVSSEDRANPPPAEPEEANEPSAVVLAEPIAVEPQPTEAPVEAVEAVTQPEDEPVILESRFDVALFERRAPSGKTCAAVHVGTADAELTPVPRQDSGRFATSRIPGLCGLQFAIESFGPPRYIAAIFDITSGRGVKPPRLPASLGGNQRLDGIETWSIDLPYRMMQPLEYRFIVIASPQPATDEAERLLSRSDWATAAAELASREIDAVVMSHRVIP